jgi:hypothetical protein
MRRFLEINQPELPMVAMFVNGSGLMSNLHRGSSIDASYQVSVHLAKRFQRRRFSPQTILVSDWLISKKSSPMKPHGQMNRNLVGSILGRSSIRIAHLVQIRACGCHVC